MSVFIRVENDPRDYDWGIRGGISELMNRPVSDRLEAELWLGSHPTSPSRVLTGGCFQTLEDWEKVSMGRLPFLLKVLAAAEPLSLQVHPSAARAVLGFHRESADHIPLCSASRNYKDPYAKPELLVAVWDGFEALCGFRSIEEIVRDLSYLEWIVEDCEPFAVLRSLVQGESLAESVKWILSEDSLSARLMGQLAQFLMRDPGAFPVTAGLLGRFRGDHGVAVSLLLNHVVLKAGEALWVAPGTIHAYLGGVGVELMGPSDNVVRCGLTGKHVDVPELLDMLDCRSGPPPYLDPVLEGRHVKAYLPAMLPDGEGVEFWLREVTGEGLVRTTGPAILLVIVGEFDVQAQTVVERVRRGEAVFFPEAGVLRFLGSGRAFVAGV